MRSGGAREGNPCRWRKNLFGFGKKDQQLPKEGDEEAVVEDSSRVGFGRVVGYDKHEGKIVCLFRELLRRPPQPSPLDAKEKPKEKKLVVVNIDHTVQKAGTPQISKADLTARRIASKPSRDPTKRDANARKPLNQLESFTYTVRDLP